MPIRLFLDANVFIGSMDKNHQDFASCNAFFDLAKQQGAEFYTSCDLITTVYYIAVKLGKQIALTEIDKINKICEIIKFDNFEMAQTIRLMQEDSDYHDLEDSLQYVLAKKVNCDFIISNDKNFTAKGIKLLSTAEFVNENSD